MQAHRSAPKALRNYRPIALFLLGGNAFDETALVRSVAAIPVSVQKEQARTLVYPRTIRAPPHENHSSLSDHKQNPTAHLKSLYPAAHRHNSTKIEYRLIKREEGEHWGGVVGQDSGSEVLVVVKFGE